mgnify:CR=1 FL=1
MKKKPYEYAKLTWPEVNEAVKAGKVAIIPVGMIEDHGHHLPIDTDLVLANAMVNKLAERIPDEIVVLPAQPYGYSPHHIDGPGVITIHWDTYINYLKDICDCLCYHGFRKIIMINGHGSNRPVMQMAARLSLVDNPDCHVASLSWFELKGVQEAFKKIRGSEYCSHADEAETSVYLAADPDKVYMDKAVVKEYDERVFKHFGQGDLFNNPPAWHANSVQLNEYWSTVTKTGVFGDPSIASAEKGKVLLDAFATEMVEIVREFKARKIVPRDPRQLPEVTARNARMGFFKNIK